MDYNRPLNASSENPKVHIALVMVPGKHFGKKASTSPLLLNPGVPGGSGVALAIGCGPRIHKIVGEAQDVIGFDPRGIGATTPRADCFSYPPGSMTAGNQSDDDEDLALGNLHRFLWNTEGAGIGIVNSSSDAFPKLDLRARTLAKLCQEKDSLNGKDSILRHVSTPSVARDMLSIIDAWDDWTSSFGPESSETPDESVEVKELEPEDTSATETDHLSTKGKLVYWGFSYGVCYVPSRV